MMRLVPSSRKSYEKKAVSRQLTRHKERAIGSARVCEMKVVEKVLPSSRRTKRGTYGNLSVASFVFYTVIFSVIQPITFFISFAVNFTDPRWLINSYFPTVLVSGVLSFLILFPLTHVKASWGMYYETKGMKLFKLLLLINTWGFWLALGLLEVVLLIPREYFELMREMEDINKQLKEAEQLQPY